MNGHGIEAKVHDHSKKKKMYDPVGIPHFEAPHTPNDKHNPDSSVLTETKLMLFTYSSYTE